MDNDLLEKRIWEGLQSVSLLGPLPSLQDLYVKTFEDIKIPDCLLNQLYDWVNAELVRVPDRDWLNCYTIEQFLSIIQKNMLG